MVYLITAISVKCLRTSIRTRIVMVYLIRLKRLFVLKQRCIRTRIVMVYHRSNTSHFRPSKVFVQELLWFIIFDKLSISEFIEYSYKNCYGLSTSLWSGRKWKMKYSYKNCYGLSKYVFSKWILSKIVFVQKLLWFIRKGAGSYKPDSRVFVQKLLWFIPGKLLCNPYL